VLKGEYLVNGAVVDEDGESQLVLILGDVCPRIEEGVAHAHPNFLGVKKLVCLEASSLQKAYPTFSMNCFGGLKNARSCMCS